MKAGFLLVSPCKFSLDFVQNAVHGYKLERISKEKKRGKQLPESIPDFSIEWRTRFALV